MPEVTMEEVTEFVDAEHGERMIALTVRFFTDGLAESEGQVRTKHCWGSGMISVRANSTHGIRSKPPAAFNSLAEIPAVIEELLIDREIVVHPSHKMKKYMASRGASGPMTEE